MLILIAESKTMASCDIPQTEETLSLHSPIGIAVAEEVMAKVAQMPVEVLAERCKFSGAMAMREVRMAYEFPNRRIGEKAIDAFTGVVFKALDFNTLPYEGKKRGENDVRIISSLYGWLRPDDIIKPYRFDFTTSLAPGNKSFAAFWRKDVTIALVKEIKARSESEILNLLPSDAAKCVDWKLVKRFAKVWKADFKEIKDGGSYTTPHAGKLKTCRGELLRAILSSGISDVGLLKELATDSLLPLGTPDYPDHIAFCV